MEIQIITRETIKPSSSTPVHLRTYKLCLFDQLASPIYFPITLFYSSSDGNPFMNSHHLKTSLSKALTQFYPLAGSLNNDHLTIDCNDRGATFIESQVACNLSFVLEEPPEIEVLQQLLPCDDDPLKVFLAVQVTYFACGGMAIGVCISHVIADASACAHFLKSWAEVACGADDIEFEGIICECSSIFPPRDLSIFYKVMSLAEENNSVELEPSAEDNIVTKRFLFDGSKIVALRNEMEDGLNYYSFRPTRVEAVTALIWEALMAATAEYDGISQALDASIAVNMRKRMDPPLPQQCIGSICFLTNARARYDELENRWSLCRKIHESINKIDDEYIRNVYTNGEGFNKFMEEACEEYEKNPKLGVFYFTSWCRFPFYETDFGFGKPKWVEGALRGNRVACFLDTSDGEGIEAWITLSKKEMTKVEQQNGILAYAAFKPSI